MKKEDLAALANAIEARVQVEVDARVGPLEARLIEAGKLIADLSGRLLSAEARIEQVAKEPRVHVHPAITVEAPAVHVAPTIHVHPRKPTKKTFAKQVDGSFKIEESE